MRVSRHLLSSLVIGASVAALAAPAEAQVRQFDIPAGNLESALDMFARQSGKQVIYRIDDVQNARTSGVHGSLDAPVALSRLLAGSGFAAKIDSSGALAVLPHRDNVKAVPSDDSAQLVYEDIVITGTRLHRWNGLSPASPSDSVAPIISVSGEEIRRTGKTAVGEVLNDLPALRTTLSQSNSSRIDTGAGLNMLDLRGLGINRTLVLQNGRRHVPGAPFTTAVDVNSIPADLIERVDIVTGGSSAVYGSDAVAGVVNFILKQNFEGLRVRAQSGVSQHGDASQAIISLIGGTNFGDDRGNVAASAEFSHQDDWYASDRKHYRDAAMYVLVDLDDASAPNHSDGVPDRILVRDLRGLTTSNGGSFLGSKHGADGNVPSYIFQPDGTLTLQTGSRVGLPPFASYSGGNGSNLIEGKMRAIFPDVKRYNFNLLGHFTVSDAFEPFIEAKYARIMSDSSAFGAFFTAGVWGPREIYTTDNPFLLPETRDFIKSSMGLSEGEDSRFFFRRHFEELGPLAQHNQRDTYRIVAGTRGTFGHGWTYEASANLARTSARTIFTNNVNLQRFLLAIDAVRDPATGRIVCRSQLYPEAAQTYENAVDQAYATNHLQRDVDECVPLNPFGEGNISQAARDYIVEGGVTRSRVEQKVLNAFVTGDSGAWFELPGGPADFALGAEYRRETFRDVQDELLQAGITHATPLPPFEPPPFAVKELFGELRLPLLKDKAAFKELTVNGAARVADYRGSVGTVFAWNAGVQWVPIPDLRFRISRSRAVRAPNAVESFQPLGQAFSNVAVMDPCTARAIDTGAPSRKANCLQDGVPQGFEIFYPASFGYLSGGNPDLHEETSRSLTVGAVLQPHSILGLRLSVDYYDIKVQDVITSPSVQAILNACYDSASLDNPFCPMFDRNRTSGSGPNHERPGEIIRNSLHVTPLNYAALKVRGVDVELAYRRTISQIGSIDTRLLYTLALQNDSFLDPGDPGRKDQNLLELGNPRHALNWEVELKHSRLSVGYRLRYFSKMAVDAIEDFRSVQGRPPQDEDAYDRHYLSGATYHDLRMQFELRPGFTCNAGVDNLTNRLPPPSINGVDDEGGIYDNIGRFLYAGAVLSF